MVILPKFRREGNTFFAEGPDCICPICEAGKVIPISSCKRKSIEIDGESEIYEIPVGRCQNSECCRYHRMLPPSMVPYKHYSAQAIDGILLGIAQSDPSYNLSAPSASSIRRWKAWLLSYAPVLIDFLKTILGVLLSVRVESTSILSFLASSYNDLPAYWFESFICFCVNNNRMLL